MPPRLFLGIAVELPRAFPTFTTGWMIPGSRYINSAYRWGRTVSDDLRGYYQLDSTTSQPRQQVEYRREDPNRSEVESPCLILCALVSLKSLS